ncbi:MAG: phospholipase D-like domain-containing protein, partial [Firmicutes bacterium]|nr:phospholipase D-like domain-containing protein [Bacillota bacterium]
MRIIKKIITRMNITILLLLFQIALILVIINRMMVFVPTFTISMYIISLLVVLMLVKKDKAAAYKVAWIIIIMGLPFIGGVLYLLFGDKRPVKRIAVHMNEHALIAKVLDADSNLPDISKLCDTRRADSFEYVRRASSYHVYENTRVEYYPMGELMFEDMLAELSRARKFIFMEYFIVKKSEMWDRICEVLVRKAAEGVDVRLIVDDLGSLKLFSTGYVTWLQQQKIRVIRFNPIVPFLSLFMNNRDHRKILVIDGHTAFNGGINISDEYINLTAPFGIWKDTGLRLKGDAVWSFTLMFIEIWDTFCKKEERIDDYELYRHMPEPGHETDGLVLPYG